MASESIEVFLKLIGSRQFQTQAKDSAKSIDKIDDASKKATGSTSKFGSSVGAVGTSTEKTGKKVGGARKGFSVLGGAMGGLATTGVAGAAIAGTAALTATLKIGIGEYIEASKIAAQTNAVIKSTGGAANVSAGDVSNLAESIMKKTGLDDETIASGENLLLTFKNIRNEAGKGNDIFNQTTGIMADMSVALGQDTNSSAIQLGKALNDPIKGITALSRVGVSFTEGQKDQIKSLVESGKRTKAQKLILRELNSEFKGSAEAAGKTLPGRLNILRETFNNLAGDLVAKVAPILDDILKWAMSGGFKSIGDTISDIAGGLKPAIPLVKFLGKAIVFYFQKIFPVVLKVVIFYLRIWFKVLGFVLKILFEVGKIGVKVFKWIVRAAINTWKWIKNAFNNVKRAATNAFNWVKNAATDAFNFVKTAATNAKNWVRDRFNDIVDFAKSLPGKIWNQIKKIPGKFKEVGRLALEGLKTSLSGGLDLAISIGKVVANAFIGFLNDAIPNKIPVPAAPDISLPDNPIPTFARGGIMGAAGTALVGERGPELVRLPTGAQVTPLPAGLALPMGGVGGSNRPIIVHSILDGRLVSKSVARHVDNQRARR